MNRRWFVALFAGMTLALGTAGCGGGSASTDSTTTSGVEGSALTEDQATTLAQVLFRNYQDGGAAFEVELPSAGQLVATLDGEVDWVGHVAQATYAPTGGSARTTEYVWNGEIVLDGGIDGLEAAMVRQGRRGITWVSRPLDPTRAPLDGVLALVMVSSSTRPDNAQLLRRDARYLRRDTLDGKPVDVIKFKTNLTYYIGVADGLIHQITARFKSFSDPVVLSFSDRGPRVVHSPAADTVVDASSIPDLYRDLTGRPAPTDSTPRPSGPTSTQPG